jgi:sigma-B regulation protein RsbU (phosphoserine phosphatase)
VSYANAGHPSPLYVRRKKKKVEYLMTEEAESGPALGVFQDAAYTTSCSELAVGDFLILLTDGLFEVEGADGEFGEERLMDIVRRNLKMPCAKLFDQLLEEIQRFSGKGEFEDDVCMVGIEVMRLGPTK